MRRLGSRRIREVDEPPYGDPGQRDDDGILDSSIRQDSPGQEPRDPEYLGKGVIGLAIGGWVVLWFQPPFGSVWPMIQWVSGVSWTSLAP